jgi:Tol biopolymer transport system component
VFPFWSPDGKYIGFYADEKLKKISVAGGTPEVLADAAQMVGGTWNRSGDIVFASGDGLHQVSAAGGSVAMLIPGLRSFSSPCFLPDGKQYLFTVFRNNSMPEGVYVAKIGEKSNKRILPGVYSNIAYAAPAWIFYSRDGDLRVQRVDPKALTPIGDPVRIADRLQYDPDGKTGLFAASGEGALVYVEGEGAGQSELVWVSRDGKDLGPVAPPAMFYTPRLSHDEKRIAVDISEKQTARGDVWIFDLAHATSSRLTYDPVNESCPTWSPDDRYVYFFTEKRGQLDLHRRPASGTGTEEPVLVDSVRKLPLDISPDGRWLAYDRMQQGRSDTDLAVLDLSTKKSQILMDTPFAENSLQFSPDGKWIAYVSNESGSPEVYVQQFPEPTGKWIVSRGGGEMPAWSADGKQIYYLSNDRKLLSVPVILGTSAEAGAPVTLIDAHVRRGYGYRQYAVSRDGSKFLLNRMVGEQGMRPMTLVQNWADSLKP